MATNSLNTNVTIAFNLERKDLGQRSVIDVHNYDLGI